MPKETLLAAIRRQNFTVVNHPEDKNYEAQILNELDNSTDFNATDGEHTALMIACQFHNYLAVNWLFSKRGFINKVHFNQKVYIDFEARYSALSFAVSFADLNSNDIDYTLKRKRYVVDLIIRKLNETTNQSSENNWETRYAIPDAVYNGNLYFINRYATQHRIWREEREHTWLILFALTGGLPMLRRVYQLIGEPCIHNNEHGLEEIIRQAYNKDVNLIDFLIQQPSFVDRINRHIRPKISLNETLFKIAATRPHFVDVLYQLTSDKLLILLNEAFSFNDIFSDIVSTLKNKQFNASNLENIFIKACYANDIEKVKLLLSLHPQYQFDTNTGYPKSNINFPTTTDPRLMNLLTTIHYLTILDEVKAKEAFKLLTPVDNDFIIKHFDNSPVLTKNFVSKVYSEVLNPELQNEGSNNINYVPPPEYPVDQPSVSQLGLFSAAKINDNEDKQLYTHYQTHLNLAQQNFLVAQSNLELAKNNFEMFVKAHPEFDEKVSGSQSLSLNP